MQIDIQSKIKDYKLLFTDNLGVLKDLSKYAPRIVIIDENVYKIYGEQFSDFFSSDEIILFKAIEANKNVKNVLSLCEQVMTFSAKKNMTIISIGGGITQDVTGFLSSILYRGINWIFVPTTLLAQSDSCMGSKTSLNHGHFKNLLGSFYPPSQVYINVGFTQTLSETDFYSGIGEIVKLHLMGGKENALTIIEKIKSISNNKADDVLLLEMVRNSLAIKYSYIKDDEFDTGRRNLLNYGHCFGHALESSSDYQIPHGTAVVIGIIFANIIAVKRGLLDEGIAHTLLNHLLLKCIKCPLKKSYFQKDILLSAMQMDKKRVGKGLPLIVLHNSFELSKLIDITPEELFDGIDVLFNNLELENEAESI